MRVTNNILIKFGTQQLEWEYKGNFIVTCFHYFKICLCVSAFTWIENKYHSEILRYFQGCRSFRRRRKEEGLWHWCGDQSAHKRVFCQQGSPNRSFSADSSSHSLAFHINASFQASWPCWGTHSFLGQWRSQLSFDRGAGSPSWSPSWQAWGGISSSPNPKTALAANNSAPPQWSPYHETCGRMTAVRHWHKKLAASTSRLLSVFRFNLKRCKEEGVEVLC